MVPTNATIRGNAHNIAYNPCLVTCFPKRGPRLWVPPQGNKRTARKPKEAVIVEVPGEKARTIFWPGLINVIEEVTAAAAATGLWSAHSCKGCRKDIEVDGEVHSVNVATVFAMTSTGHAKCNI